MSKYPTLHHHKMAIQESCEECQRMSDDHYLNTGESCWFICPKCEKEAEESGFFEIPGATDGEEKG